MKKHFFLIEVDTEEPLQAAKYDIWHTLRANPALESPIAGRSVRVKNFRKVAGNQAALDKLWKDLG